MATDNKQCICNTAKTGVECRLCGTDMLLPYWCETCKKLVAEKRCPACGLKCRKVRHLDQS
ncbi:MAG: hypothetical protein A2076_11945 [Geobacteraceae bacterium GWC2_53_11]|nr:MAG: hypothetical protein A2076_11945 [Geobacteraceae bacterium GWC2_53_11]